MREHRPRQLAALIVGFIVLGSQRAAAQAGLPQLEDASIAPRGLLRLRAATVWTRYDDRFAASGFSALGAPYNADSLGVAQVPDLVALQTAMQSAAGSPFVLSLGKSRFNAMAREEHIPITVEYGLTRRLQVSLMVPVIRKRRTGFLRLDSAGSNIGPNPQRLTSTAATTNGLVQTQFSAAASQLQQRLTFCSAPPNQASPGCPALLARQPEADTLILLSTAFASDVATVYGTTGTQGMAFVPRTQSAAQAAIAARVSSFNFQYMDLLTQSTDILTAVPVGALGPAGTADLEAYVSDELGRDSVQVKEVQGVGDYELGATFLALDINPRGDGNRYLRMAVASSVRFASGTRRAPSGITDMRIGDGGIGFTARAVVDMQTGRFGMLGGASLTSVGSGPASTPNDATRYAFDLAPRLHVTSPLAVHGAWSFRNGDLSGTTQLVGGGVSFTTVNRYRPGARPLPMEMRFSHLQAIRGDAGLPRLVRDQLEVRIYYQPGGRPAAAGGASPPPPPPPP